MISATAAKYKEPGEVRGAAAEHLQLPRAAALILVGPPGVYRLARHLMQGLRNSTLLELEGPTDELNPGLHSYGDLRFVDTHHESTA